jgi:SpoVK/Ycf46/Vps4 family AAA+-type ATPase
VINEGDDMSGHPRDLFQLHDGIKDKSVIVIMTGGDKTGGMIGSWPGIAASYNTIRTQNYTQDELLRMFGLWLQRAERPILVEGGYEGQFARLFVARVARAADSESFTNAWALREAMNVVSHRMGLRLAAARAGGKRANDRWLVRQDLVGEHKPLTPETCPAWKELLDMTGLAAIKQSIRALAHQMDDNEARQAAGKKPILATPNRVFLGNPGTGKTTVARLYGRILKHLGLLSSGELLLRNASDLIDRYIGGSEANTKEILAAARGNVLVIDDAYVLDPGCRPSGNSNANFRGAVLDTLVSEVANAPGEDRCIILAGYRDSMLAMFQNANPGLRRRFPVEDAFVFDDYTRPELESIFDLKLAQDEVECAPLAKEVALDMLERAKDRPHFANGAEVDNLLSKAKLARNRRAALLRHERQQQVVVDSSSKCAGSKRATKAKKKTGAAAAAANSEDAIENLPLQPHDFDPNYDRASRARANCAALFADMVGFQPVVSQFRTYQRIAAGMRARGLDPRPQIPFTFVFRGPPGTGKTTTARRVGRIFYDMGFLASDEVVECSASDMVAEYSGQTGPKVNRLLESALGKVLFIDEAYRLCDSGRGGCGFEGQAIGELVDAVTKPQFARRMVIILAGYDADMTRLLASNAGLRSRFATDVVFAPLAPEQCLAHLARALADAHIALEPAARMPPRDREHVLSQLVRAAKAPGWASGRSVQAMARAVVAGVFSGGEDEDGNDEEGYELDEAGMAVVSGAQLGRLLAPLVPQVQVQIGFGDRKVWR